MTITNKYGLPEALVLACETSPHNRENAFSATTLLKGVREVLLTKRHWGEMSEDVSERVWALFGTAFHELMEVETPDTFTEKYFEVGIGDYKVTGKVDLYDTKGCCIWDYKTTSVWKVIYKNFDDWKKQGLIYAWLMREAGYEVKKCNFIALLKDHKKREAKIKSDYPQFPVYVYSFDVTDEDLFEIESFIYEKVSELVENIGIPDYDLPLCSKEERWAKPPQYAVMRKGRKTALRVVDTMELAEQIKDGMNDDNVYIEERAGSDGKCEDYCSCCEWCTYYQEKYAKKEGAKNDS